MIVQYKNIKAGQLFRFVEPELIRHRGEWMPPKTAYDSGVFVKIGDSHAVRVQSGMSRKTVIPGLNVKCLLLPGKHDTSYLEDWAIVSQPFSRKQ